MEDSFAIQLLETFKAFEFRTLWKAEDKLFKFERTASETAKGSGKLQGVLQLTKSLEKLEELESKGRQCFTKFRYTTGTDKWSFDNVKNAAVSKLCACISTPPACICVSVYIHLIYVGSNVCQSGNEVVSGFDRMLVLRFSIHSIY